jgi:2-haloacid dehalogenase
MYNHLLFDADGTLFDFNAAEAMALEAMFNEFGIACTPEMKTLYSTVNHAIWKEFEKGNIRIEDLKEERFHRFFKEIGSDHNPVLASERYLDHLAQSDHLLPKAFALLTTLKSMGFQLSLITNGISRVQRGRLDATKTTSFFDHIVISEEIGIQKPEVGFFQQLFTLAKMDESAKREALVIGDSLSSDILGGNKAGLATCWYNPHKIPPNPSIVPTYEIADLEELFSILHTHGFNALQSPQG